ncbi:MAG: type II/IV secretion system protein [Deltaproteobacteria bacterium]|nr:MAG: type II/IV secretion system protein [Deltaproteobacteria bacterium]
MRRRQPRAPAAPTMNSARTTSTPCSAANRRGDAMIVAQRVGNALVQEGRLTTARLRALLSQPPDDTSRPAWQLVQAQVIDETEWAERIAAHFGMASARLADFQIERDLIAKVPEEFAKRFQLLPLCNAGGEVYVATANPTAIEAFDHVASLVGAPVQPVVVPPSDLEQGFRQFYADEDVSDLETMSVEDLSLSAAEVARLREDGESDQVVKVVDRLLARALALGASDIHIEPGPESLGVRFRVDGLLREGPTFPKAFGPPVASRIKVLAQLDIAERYVPQDGRVRMRKDGQEVDLRISVVPVAHGEKVVIRMLGQSNVQRSLADLGFGGAVLDRLRAQIRKPHGMVLVTGPTGSGKSTTLYASLFERMDPTINIVTIEDPIEYQIRGLNQIAVNPKRGVTFALALRAILRQDPDVILVGEIRDRETGVIATEAAMTGHLLLSTLHTNDAPSAIQRMIELGIPRYTIAPTVNAILAQRLIRKVCPVCSEVYSPSADEVASVLPGAALPGVRWRRARGCADCDFTGYKGRLLVYELMEVTDRMRQMIADGATTAELAAAARENGMEDMVRRGIELLFEGKTTVAEIHRVLMQAGAP